MNAKYVVRGVLIVIAADRDLRCSTPDIKRYIKISTM